MYVCENALQNPLFYCSFIIQGGGKPRPYPATKGWRSRIGYALERHSSYVLRGAAACADRNQVQLRRSARLRQDVDIVALGINRNTLHYFQFLGRNKLPDKLHGYGIASRCTCSGRCSRRCAGSTRGGGFFIKIKHAVVRRVSNVEVRNIVNYTCR